MSMKYKRRVLFVHLYTYKQKSRYYLSRYDLFIDYNQLQYYNISNFKMRACVLLMLVVALTATHLQYGDDDWAPPANEFFAPTGQCKADLHNKVDNDDGKLVVKVGGRNYDDSCTNPQIESGLYTCVLRAECKDRRQIKVNAEVTLSGKLAKACCGN